MYRKLVVPILMRLWYGNANRILTPTLSVLLSYFLPIIASLHNLAAPL
jgi:hypothetical protein